MKRPNRVFQRALIGGLIGFLIFAGATDYFIQGIPEKAMPGPGGFMGPYFLGPAIGSVLGVLSGTLSPKRSTDTEDKN